MADEEDPEQPIEAPGDEALPQDKPKKPEKPKEVHPEHTAAGYSAKAKWCDKIPAIIPVALPGQVLTPEDIAIYEKMNDEHWKARERPDWMITGGSASSEGSETEREFPDDMVGPLYGHASTQEAKE